MRILLTVLILGFLNLSCSQIKQTLNLEKRLYIIHIHGDWCSTCSKIDTILEENEEYFKGYSKLEYIIFDQSTPESLAISKMQAKHLGLEKIFENERHTGEVLFIDQGSKKILGKFYGVKDKEKYRQAAEELLAGKAIKSIAAKKRTYILSKPDLETVQKAKLYVIDIHHDMCGGCAITAPVFEKVALDYKENPDIVFMTFDLTTPETIKQTRELAEKTGLKEIYDSHKHTGEVLFVDAKNKQIVKTLVLEKDAGKYHNYIKEVSQNW